MKRFILLGFLCIIICHACEEENTEPKMKGDVTLSSEILGTSRYFVDGFSFE